MATILILYHSQEYGNTELMAKAVAEGIKSAKAKVVLINTNEKRMAIDEFREYDAVAFGSPDYFGYIAGGLKVFLDDFYIARKESRKGLEKKPYALFYSHGGGGDVRKPFEKLFALLKVGPKIGETIESYGQPNNSVLTACKKMGKQLVKATKKE
jgi:multimeric flavodoxin WrbA